MRQSSNLKFKRKINIISGWKCRTAQSWGEPLSFPAPLLFLSLSLSFLQRQRLVCNYMGDQQKNVEEKTGVVYFTTAAKEEWHWGRRWRSPHHGPTDCLLLILNLIITSKSGSGSKWIYLLSVKSSHLRPGNHPKVQIQKMDRTGEMKAGRERLWPLLFINKISSFHN